MAELATVTKHTLSLPFSSRIPVIDKSGRKDGTFERSHFTFDTENDLYICPNGKELKQFWRAYKTPRPSSNKDETKRLVQSQLRQKPFDGSVYVFRAKRADRLKLIYWDGNGLAMAYTPNPLISETRGT